MEYSNLLFLVTRVVVDGLRAMAHFLLGASLSNDSQMLVLFFLYKILALSGKVCTAHYFHLFCKSAVCNLHTELFDSCSRLCTFLLFYSHCGTQQHSRLTDVIMTSGARDRTTHVLITPVINNATSYSVMYRRQRKQRENNPFQTT